MRRHQRPLRHPVRVPGGKHPTLAIVNVHFRVSKVYREGAARVDSLKSAKSGHDGGLPVDSDGSVLDNYLLINKLSAAHIIEDFLLVLNPSIGMDIQDFFIQNPAQRVSLLSDKPVKLLSGEFKHHALSSRLSKCRARAEQYE